MAVVFLGVGSNINAEENLRVAIAGLRRHFSNVELSNVYQSKALGFEGADFLNLVARVETDKSPTDVCAVLETLHDESGRERGAARFVSRPLDVDLLLYADLVMNEAPVKIPRKDVLEYSFVLLPLAEIAPDYIHPVTGLSIRAHAEDFDANCHPIEKKDVIL